MDYQEILAFWFEECEPSQWFKKDLAFDDLIKERFSMIHTQVAQGEKSIWRKTIEGRLAEIIVLDQFSRNLFRGDPESFAYDGMALVLTQEAIATDDLDQLTSQQRSFLFMPLMHSESLIIHEEALKRFAEKGMEHNLEFENKHRDILVRFGRYPHRNTLLGRCSTEEEITFLKEPGSSF
ncbi:hypothetical protein UAW_00271 [Enterococcus haemoperoxidus ATCC BAA-382]|uniref:DUF924 domain-containing protein n=1 Tax=Enterococcus haemoperoxidus ATCC BAA-382 TaxID=1158608 RepID=R2TIY6_9ENTE|nr:DUF924 family protein [Enterococcus haemoperoxidus]EOI00097.1 hypothetical protein UAW_00271 [Enterococcus haemoperoxidus ATCC BAA-382]EOT63137.1 hypothetical protein I583_02140 [Enterococcus haemoperoxidus ATCC BAA-382]OJG53581.1 hypothetical protein RV06_GL000655 [Enterococcus haemoperoxidus]